MADERASKWLSFVLRHDPESAGLEMDAGGRVEIASLLAASKRVRDRAHLERVVADNNKKRFAISDDGLRIRARQGHSIAVDLGLEAQTPPDTLFHGTATRFLDTILVEGLKKMNRQHVHLSRDVDTARSVGQRYGEPVILEVAAGQMAEEGLAFYLSENGVWLTDAVEQKFLRVKEA